MSKSKIVEALRARAARAAHAAVDAVVVVDAAVAAPAAVDAAAASVHPAVERIRRARAAVVDAAAVDAVVATAFRQEIADLGRQIAVEAETVAANSDHVSDIRSCVLLLRLLKCLDVEINALARLPFTP